MWIIFLVRENVNKIRALWGPDGAAGGARGRDRFVRRGRHGDRDGGAGTYPFGLIHPRDLWPYYRITALGGVAIDKTLSWKESYAVGHDGLDAEHRQMLTTINGICDACTGGQPARSIYALLTTLERETLAHLEHENVIMREIFASTKKGMDADVKAMTRRMIAGHVAEHERNLSDLRKIMRAARTEPDCRAAHICAEIKQWFFDHAVKYDAHLKAIFQAI